MKKISILLIDDEPIAALAIKDTLSAMYNVTVADTGQKGIEAAREVRPELILLDLNMPGLNGFDVCEKLRSDEVTMEIPIIVVTGSEDVDSRIRAYNLGADDFLVKPFKPAEILARVHSKVRRLMETKAAPGRLACGNLVMDENSYEVVIAGRRIEISLMEFNLLKFFVQNFGRIINRRQILESVWKGHIVSSRTIDSHVLSLRKKTTEFSHEIVSMYGVGYGIKEKSSSN